MFSLMGIVSKEQLEKFCCENHIIKLSLFGSALHDNLKPESDIDILVEFDREHVPGLLSLAGMENNLTDMIRKKVDLRTPEELNRYFRDDVLTEAKVEYAVK